MAAGDNYTSKLIVQMGVKLNDLEKGMRKANGQIEKFTRQTQRNARKSTKAWAGFQTKMMGLLSGAVVIAGVRALGRAFSELVQELDNLAKSADALGITVEQFTALRGIAQESGVEQEKFSKAMQKLNKVITDAGDGLTTYTRAFDRLGINIRNADGSLKNTKQIFFELKGAVDKYGNSQKVIASMMDIFGARVGAKMIRVLKDMEDSMEGVVERGREMGVVIEDRIVRKAEVMANQWTLTGQAIKSMLATAIEPAIPMFRQLADETRELATELKYLMERGRDFSMMSVEAMRRELKELEDKRAETGPAPWGSGRGLEGGLTGQLLAKYQDAPREEELRKVLTRYDAVSSYMKDSDRASAAHAKEAAQAAAMQAATGAGAKPQKDLMAGVRKKLGIADPDDVFDYGEAESTLKAQDEEIARKAEHAKRMAEAQEAENERAIEARKEYYAKQAAVQAEADEAALAELRRAEEAKMELAATFEANLTDAMMRLVDGTESVGDAFKNLVKQMLMSMIQQKVMAPIAQGITGAIFGGAAAGGPVQAGRPIMVGEHGREVFVPGQGGRVLSHPQTERALGGGGTPTINLSFSIQSTDGPGVRRAISEAVPSIVNAAKGALLEDMRRPSPVRQVMRGHA